MFSTLLFSIALNFYGVDLGSEYLKVAEPSLMGDPKMKLTPNGKNFRGAIAYRKPQFVEQFNSSASTSKAELRYGEQALKTLKSKPENGIAYLGRAIGRNESSEFQTSKLLSARELMSIYLQNFVNQLPSKIPIVYAVPGYWTRQMKYELNEMSRDAEIQVQDIFEDSVAVASHYESIFYKKLMNTSKSVLFVDVGATSVKAYGYYFSPANGYVVANATGYSWSEKTGSYYFAKAISEAKKISMKKASRFFLQRKTNEYINDVKQPTEELIRVVKEAAQNLVSFISADSLDDATIDEVQIFGGISRIDFISKVVQKAAGVDSIMHEFNPSEAIAKGIVSRIQMNEGETAYPPLQIYQKDEHQYYFKFHDTEYTYCTKEGACRDIVQIQNPVLDDQTIISLYTTPEEVSQGAETQIMNVELLNISNVTLPKKYSSTRIELFMAPPYPDVRGVRFCVDKNCYPIAIDKKGPRFTEVPKNVNFTVAVLNEGRTERLFMAEYKRVEDMISQIQTQIESKLSAKGLTEENIPADLYSTFKKYLNALEDGSLMERSIEGLRDALTDLKINSKYIYDAISKMKSKKKVSKVKKTTEDIFESLKEDVNTPSDEKTEEQPKEETHEETTSEQPAEETPKAEEQTNSEL